MLRILDITAPDINNGNGIRVTLWVSGCKHHCKGCHNQWTWDFNKGKNYRDNIKEIHDKLENWLSRDYVEGLTISGGDPLCQDDEALIDLGDIIQWVQNIFNKNVWIYTGYVYEDLKGLQKEIADLCDVLVDGPFIEEKKDFSCPFRGSSNQRIIKMKEKNKNS